MWSDLSNQHSHLVADAAVSKLWTPPRSRPYLALLAPNASTANPSHNTSCYLPVRWYLAKIYKNISSWWIISWLVTYTSFIWREAFGWTHLLFFLLFSQTFLPTYIKSPVFSQMYWKTNAVLRTVFSGALVVVLNMSQKHNILTYVNPAKHCNCGVLMSVACNP